MKIHDRGDGEAVVLIHGANPVSYFDELLEALEARHRVIVPEMPGWGDSPPLPEGQSFEVTDRALLEQLEELGIRRAALLGYSLGGWRALDLALSGTLEVSSIYLLSTFTASPTGEIRQLYRNYADLARSGADLRPAVRELYLPPEYAAAHPDIHDEVTDWVNALPQSVFALELAAVAELRDLVPELPALEVPVTARVGAADIAAPEEWSRSIIDAVPNGRIEVVEGCGHVLLYEDRDATVASVLNARDS
ncbi:MAG: alpha/beta fold hydrolase [Alkalispirochaetaceae bacterium]